MKNILIGLPNMPYKIFKLICFTILLFFVGISPVSSQLGPNSEAQFISMTTIEYNHCNNSVTVRLPIKENFNDCAISNFLDDAEIQVTLNPASGGIILHSTSKVLYNDGIQTCGGLNNIGTLQGECRSWHHCTDRLGNTFLIFPVGEYGSYGEFTIDADITGTYTINLSGRYEGVVGGGSFNFDFNKIISTPNNTEDLFCTYQRGTNDLLVQNSNPAYLFDQCQYRPLEDVWHVELPGGLESEYIRIQPDGIIWHGATIAELEDPNLRRIDRSIVYVDHFGSDKHATFDKGLFFIRQYNDETKVPTGSVLDVNSGLSYKSADPNAMDHYGSDNLEGFVQNTFFSVKEIEYLGFGNSNMQQINLWGLPLQNYQSESDTQFDLFPQYNHSRTGALYRIIDYFIDGAGGLSGGIYQQFAGLEVNNLIGSDINNIILGERHVLPNEASRFYMDIVDIRPTSCGDGNLEDLTLKLYISNSPLDLPNINSSPIAIGQLEGSGPRSRYRFDLSSLDRSGGPGSFSGPKFFTITLTDDQNPNTILNLYGLPVFIEAASGEKVRVGVGTGPPEVKVVVHDPPGNGSFATYTAGAEVCHVEENVSEVVDGFEEDHRIQIGFSGSVGEYVTGNIDINVGYHGGVETTETALTSTSREICTRFTETIETNPENGFMDRGDVFMGYAKEFELWSANRWNWDVDDGVLYPGQSLYIEITNLQTFALVEADILQRMCDLENVYQNFGPTTGANRTDKAYVLQSIESYQNMLADNRTTLIDPLIPVSSGPVEFSGNNSQQSSSSEVSNRMAQTEMMELITTEENGVDETILIVGNGFEGAQTWTVENRNSNSSTNTSGTTNMIEYSLNDNGGSIDRNVITIHEDERYGIPFFRITEDSRTSCPFEGGQRVDQPIIKERIDPNINPITEFNENKSNQIYISNVPSGSALRIPIDMCNLFEFVSPNATGSFRIIRQGTSGNNAFVGISEFDPLPDNIVDAFPVDIDFGSCFGDDENQTAISIFVKQNLANDLEYSEATDEIRLEMYSECDDEIFDVLSISVRFVNDPNAIINYHAECEFLEDTDRAMHFDGVDDHITNRIKAAPFVYNQFSYEFWTNPEGTIISQTESNTLNSLSAASSTGGFPFVVFPVDGLTDLYGLGDGTRFVQTKGQAAVGIAVGTNGVQVVEHHDKTHTPVVLQYSGQIEGWNHIAVVYERRIPKLYVNGVLVRTGVPSSFLALHPSPQIGGGDIIAPNNNAIPNYYKGKIDDLRFWNYARTENQINADKNNKLSGNEPGLMALYLFDSQEPGAANQGNGIVEFAGIGDVSDSELQNFDYNATTSNWVEGRVSDNCFCPDSTDSDGDGQEACVDLCPDDLDAALNFDGINDYVLLPDESRFDITTAITVEAWIKVTAFDIPNAAIVTKGDNTWRISRHFTYNTISFALSGVTQLDGTVDVNDGLWHHIAGVYDGSSVSLYIDGQLDVTQPASGTIVTTDDPVIIGANSLAGVSRFFNGSIDDVIIWERALSQAEIVKTISAPVPDFPSFSLGLVAYYNFNDQSACMSNSNTTLGDQSDANSNGTLINFALANGCESNWSSGRNLDSDNDGIGDACDEIVNPCEDNCNFLYVDKSAVGDNNGSSWSDAFTYLQDALLIATSGDTIYVAGGTYYPDEGVGQVNNDQDASFAMKSGVVILGGFAGVEPVDFDLNQRDITVNETILSGDIDQVAGFAGNSYHVVFNTNVLNTAVLDGFTITEGSAIFSSNINGAGIYNTGSSPIIKNCFIHRNHSFFGGGMYNILNSFPTIINCNFLLNVADGSGGAMANTLSSAPTISYSSFSGNNAASSGQAIIVAAGSGLTISHCVLWGNGSGIGAANIDISIFGGGGTCDYCIIDADGGGTYPGVGGLNQDPLFIDQPTTDINYVGGDLRLQASSPAIDFLVDATGPVLDQDGNMRPIGAGHDIGAYEFEDGCVANYDLSGNLSSNIVYVSGSFIESDQTILAPANVEYNAATEVRLNEGFEVNSGATFHAFIDGCGEETFRAPPVMYKE